MIKITYDLKVEHNGNPFKKSKPSSLLLAIHKLILRHSAGSSVGDIHGVPNNVCISLSGSPLGGAIFVDRDWLALLEQSA